MNTNHIFSAFSCIGFIIVSIPLPWHLQAWNTGTCLYMLWVGVTCLAWFINSIIWDGNVVDWAPVWCDITTRIFIGINIAIPAAGMCIQRRLYYIVSDCAVVITRAEKRRAIMIDSLICLGLPFLGIVLAYIVQPHRYVIFEDVGCYPSIMNTPLALVLISSWPITIGIVSATYCTLNIYHFWKKRRTMRALLQESSSGLPFGRYIRLMLLSGLDLFCTVPLGVWTLWATATEDDVLAWPGWTAAHAEQSVVDIVPAALWRSSPSSVSSLEFTRWSSFMCAGLFFVFFGFADEARLHYGIALKSVAKMVGYPENSQNTSSSFGPQTRSFGRPKSHDSFDTVSLPVFEKDHQSPKSLKMSPFGSSYGSAVTFSTGLGTDTKCDRSFEDLSPISPQQSSPISSPPASFNPDSGRSVRPPIMTTPLDGGFGGH